MRERNQDRNQHVRPLETNLEKRKPMPQAKGVGKSPNSSADGLLFFSFELLQPTITHIPSTAADYRRKKKKRQFSN